MIKKLDVYFEDNKVGTLAETINHKVAFQYEDQWLRNGFSISPFSLPLKKQVFEPTKMYFSGLFGVFADSLPDAWGNLLMERFWTMHGHKREELTILDRLAMIGNDGMGALNYRPVYDYDTVADVNDLDVIAEECQKILNFEQVNDLDTIYKLGGSSGGTRPKIMTELDGKDIIIKFPAKVDPQDIGQMEYDYSVCAKKCGIIMENTMLLKSKKCLGYFATERFDRVREKNRIIRKHVLTAAAILEVDYEQPSLDYHSIMKLTKIITNDNIKDMENMYLRMCFNVLAHNRDDHAKNFSYFYDVKNKVWRLAPAYDLTYSNTFYGEHTTSVDGNGQNPGEKEIYEVGKKAGISAKRCRELYSRVRECVYEDLSEYMH